jgi:uncharacterized phage protein gp47/JayE
MFRTKTFVDIVTSMLGQMRSTQTEVTDFNVGSVTRTMLESPAAEIDQLYQEMAQGLVEGIPTAIYRSFDFDLLDARNANGVIRIFCRSDHDAPVVIPVGMLASTTNGIRYQTAEGGVIPVGQGSIDILASAVEPGPQGNVPANTIVRMISSGVGITGITNPQAFSNGRGKETPAERKLRFVEYVRTLARGTPAALVYAAKQATILDPRSGVPVERVVRATVIETTGHVDLYVYNGSGGTSPALVQRVQELVDGYDDVGTGLPVAGYRPAGMRVDAQPMTEITVAVTVEAEVTVTQRTEALRSSIVAAISDAIRTVPSEGRLRPLDIVNATISFDQVAGCQIEAPLLTVLCPAGGVLVPGVITVTWR